MHRSLKMRLKSLPAVILSVSILALPVLSGCSSVAGNAAGQCAECQTLRGTGLQVSSYRFEGKAGVRRTGPDGGSASFRFVWTGTSRGSLSFRGVHFTGKSFEISAGTGGTFVGDTDGTVTEFDSEAALEKRFGVPLRKLSSWAMGNGEGADAKYEGDHLKSLKSGAWQAEFVSYGNFGGLDLPRDITLKGDGSFVKVMISKASFVLEDGSGRGGSAAGE